MKTIVGLVLVLSAFSAAENIVLGTLGQTVKIHCGVSTSNVDLIWEYEKQTIFSVQKKGMRSKGKAAMVSRSKLGKDFLEINTVEVKDVGLYTCNVAGNPHHHRLGLVSVSVHPSKDLQLGSEATLQCQVKGLDPPPAVEWERPNSEPIRQATVQLTSVSGSDRGDWTCKFTHDGKMYNKTLEIRVEEPSVSTLPTPEDHTMTNRPKTTEDPLPNKKILGLSLWMWVALGVGFLILVILLVILCCRCRRMKRRAKKLKMVRSPLKSSQYCKCKCPTAQQPAAAPPRGRQKEEPSTLPRQQR